MIRHIILSGFLLCATMGVVAQKKGKHADKRPRFIEDIEISVGAPSATNAPSASVPSSTVYASGIEKGPGGPSYNLSIEDATALHIKYALLLNTEVEALEHTALLRTIDEWWGTKYRMGGSDRNGIDCSAFTQVLYSQVFSISLPRISRDQYRAAVPVPVTDLREGDLVFFTQGGNISHVGFYLRNNKFVHASTSEGVTISDLNDMYWSKRFAGAGRIQQQTASTQSSIKP